MGTTDIFKTLHGGVNGTSVPIFSYIIMGTLGILLWWLLQNSGNKADQIIQFQEQVNDRIRLNALKITKDNEKKKRHTALERKTVTAQLSTLKPVNQLKPISIQKSIKVHSSSISSSNLF